MLSGFTSCSSSSNGQETATPWISWLEQLATHNYSVTQGRVRVVERADCVQIVSVFGTCWANDPAAPYIVLEPPINNTYIDPWYASKFNTDNKDNSSLSNLFYRLADTDAVVAIVNLPSRAAYMGYQSYVYSRAVNKYQILSLLKRSTPNPDRTELFASIGNDINNQIIANNSGASWTGHTVVYITTSSKNLSDALIADAKNNNLDTTFIFTEPVGNHVDTGTDALADDLITLIRYVLPEDEAKAEAWRAAINDNVRVYRVSAPHRAITRFGANHYTAKANIDESQYRNALDELSTLLNRWLSEKEGTAATTTDMFTSIKLNNDGKIMGFIGDNCIAMGSDCLGDNQDTDAYRRGILGTLPIGKTAIVTGVNHTLTGAATYMSLSINDTATATGVASIYQTNEMATGFSKGTLQGSAEHVLRDLGLYQQASDNLRAQLPYLYAAFISRRCEQANNTYCIQLDDKSMPLSSIVAVIQRAYIALGTTTGANPNLLLTPRVMITN
jgi:hypothetical protein